MTPPHRTRRFQTTLGVLTLTSAAIVASAASAFPALPEARAFLNPELGYLACGPASGGFAASCQASGTAYGNSEQTIAIDAGYSTASYALGSDPLVNATSNFEPTYPKGGGGYIDSGDSSGTLSYQFALCTDAACSVPGATVPIHITYALTVTNTPQSNPYGITPGAFGYIAGLDLDYYGGTPVAQYESCTYCSVETLPEGQNVIAATIRTNTVYELALAVTSEGDGISSVTLDPTLSAPAGSGTLVFSPLVTGGVPEPTTWAFMILGGAFAGSALRAKRRRVVVA